jgi:hypothetical protein
LCAGHGVVVIHAEFEATADIPDHAQSPPFFTQVKRRL